MSASPASVLLIASSPSLKPPSFLVPAIVAATRAARNNLTILLCSPLFNSGSPGSINHAQSFHDVQRLLTFVYVQATKVSQELNRILLNIDVLLRGLDDDYQFLHELDFDTLFRITGDHIEAPIPSRILSLPQTHIDRAEDPSAQPQDPSPSSSAPNIPSTYPVVAVGGTFDHLHPGHKILLSMTLFITSRKVIVGVTHSSLLRNKSNADLLESLDTRIANVRKFSKLFRPGLEVYDVVPIDDVYGPTGWDADIQALVVSKETLKGAESSRCFQQDITIVSLTLFITVASHRASKSLPPLKTFVIDVISHDSADLDDSDHDWLKNAKMSSTFIREWIARQKA
ncbi:hypothetical protein VNI00_003158 [Paramarasmius palmivorus]|uniref:Cytidyltransferase-like domain-containing protein n=1 Tax=Paramarasmius palmivorus TaxID=297713 RepID=A0AAW0DRQ3_9AGAR